MLEALREELRVFAKERDWEKFHSPKNLASALSVEASELLEIFQWLTPEESSSLCKADLERASEELGDVLIYLVRLADTLGIDLADSARRKLEKNKAKYPVEKCRGRAVKYTDL